MTHEVSNCGLREFIEGIEGHLADLDNAIIDWQGTPEWLIRRIGKAITEELRTLLCAVQAARRTWTKERPVSMGITADFWAKLMEREVCQ